MQTLPTLSLSMDPKLASQPAVHHGLLTQLQPTVTAGGAPLPTAGAQQATQQSARPDAFSDLDQMLIQDPNTGAMHGLRTALLFNAGLALSGLVIWEIWALLAL